MRTLRERKENGHQVEDWKKNICGCYTEKQEWS